MTKRTLKDALARAKNLRDFKVASPDRFEKCPDFQDIVLLADEVERLREDEEDRNLEAKEEYDD